MVRFWLSMLLFANLLAVVMLLSALTQPKWRKAESFPASMPEVNISPTLLPTLAVGPTPSAVAIESPLPRVAPSLSAAASSPAAASQLQLIIPVAAVRASDLRDTFNDARSQGRVHNAIDIMAPRGRPVLAASNGEIVRLLLSDLGGTSIYQFSPNKKIVFYYAHLDRYADGLIAGHQARQGEVIAYVGNTGNAGPGNYHLHFAMWHVTDPKRYWDGENINPYPILRQTP